ncbi:MAG: hypothetical protein RLZZ476_1878, partial [Verrucomicrobiota bacterium]
ADGTADDSRVKAVGRVLQALRGDLQIKDKSSTNPKP